MTGEMFCYKRKKLSWRAKEELKHEIGHRVIKGHGGLPYGPKIQGLLSVWPSVWPQEPTGSMEVAVTYFMTLKITVTFVVDLT